MSKKKKETNTRKIKMSVSYAWYLEKLDDILSNFEALKRTGFFAGSEMEKINDYELQTVHIFISRIIKVLREADKCLEQNIKPQKIKLTFVR